MMPLFDEASAMGGAACRLAIAAIFAQASVHALRDWPAYAAIVENFRILPPPAARLAARAVPVAELAAAALLLIPAARIAGPALGLLLMAVFTAAIGINVARGRVNIDCGCGGASGQQLSGALVVRNLLLCALLAAAAAAPAPQSMDTAFAVGVLGAAAFLVTLYFSANQLMANAKALAA
jgi:uncharacterized membrane protein YphA (DoxX/SURF4 family)